MRISDWSSDVCSSDLPRLTSAERVYIEQDGEDPAGPPLGWGQALRQRQAWYFVAAKFFTDPVWYLFLFWLPDFFARTQGLELFPTGDTGLLATIGPADRKSTRLNSSH